MTALRAYAGLLRNPALTRLLTGEFISSIGDWLYLVALLIVVYDRSQDPVLLGVVGAARVLPYVLLSVPAGIAADRFERRRILMLTDVARGVIMLGLAWLVATDGSIEAIVGLAILATCFSTFFGPAIGAYLPSLVADERQLGPANSAWATLDNLAFVIGPAIAGLLIATGGLTVAFLLNAVSFAIVAVVLWRLPKSARSSRPQSDRAAAGEPAGIAEPTALPGPAAAPEPAAGTAPQPASPEPAPDPSRPRVAVLAGLGLIDVVGSFVFGGVGVLTVILATKTYGSGESGTGYLNAAIGVGGLVGALLSGALVLRPRLGPTLIIGAVAMGAGLVGLGLSPGLGPALVALIVASAGSLILEVVSTTILQRAIPDAVRGRALGLIATASSLAFAAGSFLVPVLADRYGTSIVLGIGGLGVAVAAMGGRALVGAAASRPVSPFDATLLRVAGLPIFVGVSPARLEAALARISPRSVKPGEPIIRQGDVADRFYIVANGRFRVTQHDGGGPERELRLMGPDEVFGEIGLLRGSPRTASVTADTDGLLLALDGREFLDLVSREPALGPRLLDLRRGGTTAELGAEAGVSAG